MLKNIALTCDESWWVLLKHHLLYVGGQQKMNKVILTLVYIYIYI